MWRAQVFEVLDRLAAKDGGGLTHADLAGRCGCARSTAGKWLGGTERKVPSPHFEVPLLALTTELLGAAAADQLQKAMASFWVGEAELRQRRGRAQGDAAAAGPRVRAKWQIALDGAIETDDGIVPTVAGRAGVGDGWGDWGGVDHWRLRSSITGGALPPYVPRSIDAEIDRRLRWTEFPSAPVVVVVGPPKAGKTRTAVEALRRSANNLVHRSLHEPVRPTQGRATLTEYVEALRAAVEATMEVAQNAAGQSVGRRSKVAEAVLFVDDLQNHLTDPDDPTRGRGVSLRVLLEEVSRCMVPVIATCHPWVLETDHQQLGISEDDQTWLADRSVHLLADLDDAELDDARETLSAAGVSPYVLAETENLRLLGALLADLDTLRRMIRDARADASWTAAGAARSAAISGLCDALLFHAGPVTTSQVREYALQYADLGTGTRPLLDGALQRVTTPPPGTGNAIAPYDARTDTLGLLDALRGELLASHITVIPPHRVTPEMAVNAGDVCSLHKLYDSAASWWRNAAEAGDARATMKLAALRREQGRLDGDPERDDAANWWRMAADADREAVMSLGWLRAQQGRLEGDREGDDAVTWLRRAADVGNTNGMRILGVLRRNQGRIRGDPNGDDAITWWRMAAMDGNGRAMVDIGVLCEEQGRIDDATRWYRLAAAAEEPTGMYNLGQLRRKQGRANDASYWYRSAAQITDYEGNPATWQGVDAMYKLGLLCLERGVLEGDGDGDDAATWWRRAAESGSVEAMVSLGLLRQKQGRTKPEADGDDAKTWWNRAAESGSVVAMVSLGLLHHDGDLTN